MRLKTTNRIVLEQAIQHSDHSIELIGCKNLCECDQILENLVKENKICDKKNTFIKAFGLNSKFYYTISHRKDFSYYSHEVGLGYLEKVEDKIYLKRIHTVLVVENNQIINTYGCGHTFNCHCHEDGMLLISNYNPKDLLQLLVDKHCIISSIDECVASPVYIDKNSLIGRIENNIQSISIPSLLNQIIKYDEVEGKVKFFTGSKWITLVEESHEDTK